MPSTSPVVAPLWVNDYAIESTSWPEWATVLERLDGGRSYGTPAEFLIDGKSVATGPDNVWRKYNEYHGEAMARWSKSVSLDRNARGASTGANGLRVWHWSVHNSI